MRRFKLAIGYLLLSALTVTNVLSAFANEEPEQEQQSQSESCKDQPGGYCRLPDNEPAPRTTTTPEVDPAPNHEDSETEETSEDDHEESSCSDSPI
jgi:hypothetical protein